VQLLLAKALRELIFLFGVDNIAIRLARAESDLSGKKFKPVRISS
jgi:hypothetical protein